MTLTSIGNGIASVAPEAPVQTVEKAVDDMKRAETAINEAFVKPPETDILEDLRAEIRKEMRGEMDAAVADIERRLAQARELEASAIAIANNETIVVPRSIHTEDLNVGFPMVDGYTLTANSPIAGSIAWGSLHVVLEGVDYTISDANTANKYAYFVKPGSYTPGTPMALLTSNALPVLGSKDALIFVNNSGVPVSALESTVSYAVGPGVIGNAQLAQDVQTVISTLQANDIALQSAVDGSITTYYQNDPPWPSGSPSPAGGNINQGDVWYDSNDNGAYRWTGTSGTPANTWSKIADTDNSALAGKINTKTTTYLFNNATPPTAPAGGFTVGDLWMVLDQGNLMRRWSGAAWVDLQMGDAAISGVGGAKIGSGINASNVTTGTLAGSRVGAGINAAFVDNGTLNAGRVGPGVAGAVLNSATGNLVSSSQLGSGTVTPAKTNVPFHILY